MSKKILLGFLLIQVSAFSQISFENERLLIEQYQMPNSNSEILLEDLNNDSTKDLISVTAYGVITVCPNQEGDYTAIPSKFVYGAQSEYAKGISVIDIDNDGLKDIIACNDYSNKIIWFKNLGDFNFSGLNILINIANSPYLTSISDIDNDGLKDILIGLGTNDSVVWLKNNGDGTFLDAQIIYASNAYNLRKILAKDLNNDGLPEIVIGDDNNNVYWKKNMGNGLFGSETQLANSSFGKSFEFEDLNNDNYPDYISTSSNYIIKQLNLFGNTFGTSQSINTITNIYYPKFKDIDEDGLTDLVGSTGGGISYLKRYANGTFASSSQLISQSPVSYFIAEDLNNDSHIDFIIPSYSTISTTKKLSAYMKISNTDSYYESLISYSNSAVFNVKIADLDNDSKNDIISSFRSVVWNKNKGNGNFTSYKKVSNIVSDAYLTYDIEVVDIDNDNDNDIVASSQTIGIQVYYNDGNGNFTLGNTITLPYDSRNIEVADLNGDGLKDIALTFKSIGSVGEVCLSWIQNLTGNTFGNLTTIGIAGASYYPYLLKCEDMDNDGDIDIVTYSTQNERLNLNINNGSGVFTHTLIGDVVSAVCLAVEDYDNDGDKDIFVGGNYYPGIWLIKNNNGNFATNSLIQPKKTDALAFADINDDGLKDIIGTATETSDLGTLYYFLNNGTNFNSQTIINSETLYPLSRNIAVGNLNNDNMPDIAKSYYYIPQVSYFLNSSVLSIEENEIKDNISIYPIPFTETISWEIQNNDLYPFDITIFSLEGKLIYSKKEIKNSYLDLKSLSAGIYIFNIKSKSKSYTRKIVKN